MSNEVSTLEDEMNKYPSVESLRELLHQIEQCALTDDLEAFKLTSTEKFTTRDEVTKINKEMATI